MSEVDYSDIIKLFGSMSYDESAAGAYVDPAARWAAVATAPTGHEDRMDPEVARSKWGRIYALFGASGENARDEVKSAVYQYFCVNGTSDEGDYNSYITSGAGTSLPVKAVTEIIGKGGLRKFCRSNVSEAYYSLKYNQSLNRDRVFAKKAEDKGLSGNQCFLMADFLKGCPEFSNEENMAYTRVFSRSITRAAAARGGTLEEARGRRTASVMRAQATGHNVESIGNEMADSGW